MRATEYSNSLVIDPQDQQPTGKRVPYFIGVYPNLIGVTKMKPLLS